MKITAVSLLCVSLGSGVTVLTQDSAQRRVYRTGTDVVTIDASVWQRNTPVTGLTSADFELLDNGVRQHVEIAAVDAVPVDVSVIFDESMFALPRIGNRVESSLTKIAALLRATDRLRVITFATEVREVAPLQEPASARDRGLSGLSRSPIDSNLTAGRSTGTALDLRHDPMLRASWSDAILLAIARPPELGRRHLAIAFGAGTDDVSILRFSDVLVTIAARSDTQLHVALWKSQGLLASTYTRAVTTAAADSTGGRVHDINDAVDAFKSILAEFRQRYVLQYTLTGVAPGGWHAVTVRTPRFPQYTVRARSGYLGK